MLWRNTTLSPEDFHSYPISIPMFLVDDTSSEEYQWITTSHSPLQKKQRTINVSFSTESIRAFSLTFQSICRVFFIRSFVFLLIIQTTEHDPIVAHLWKADQNRLWTIQIPTWAKSELISLPWPNKSNCQATAGCGQLRNSVFIKRNPNVHWSIMAA